VPADQANAVRPIFPQYRSVFLHVKKLDSSMDRQPTAASINEVRRRNSPGFFGSIPLYLMVAFSLLVGAVGIFEAITLYRARTWPVVEARLDHCDMALHASKSSYYWLVSAERSYGSNHENHYSEE
jgi:hypothetical protein